MADRPIPFDKLKALLDARVAEYNTPAFIQGDPIAIPHRYTRLQDREIAGFWTAILAWGQRKTILAKAESLMDLMGDSPYDFILNHREKDREPFLEFRHRTFQPVDTLYFLSFLQQYYRKHASLEAAFVEGLKPGDKNIQSGLEHFHHLFFSLDTVPDRTRKHISTPARNGSCKRLNMFLRWMVRRDSAGVDFGIWENIGPEQLVIPLDVHVHRVATRLDLLHRKQSDWNAALMLTEHLRKFDPDDPVKYDFALFGIGVLERKAF